MKCAAIPIARARELLDYEPVTGLFRWKFKPRKGVQIGDRAGTAISFGYRAIRIDGRRYLEHRLAWAWTFGEQPPDEIDHVNGCPDDNRIANLRPASSSQNKQNTRRRSSNRSGFKGVSWIASRRKWRAEIKTRGRVVHLGYFETPEQAHAAYRAAAEKFFGEFARAA
jgi:hypothetical protein